MEAAATEVIIRAATPNDFDAVRRVVTAAFGSDVQAGLVDRIRASPEYVPEWDLVAEVDGAIAGYVVISRAVLRRPDGERPISMLSPLAVVPNRQRSGIGSTLVRAVLAMAEAYGEPMVILEGDPAYYERFGFEHAALYDIEITLPEWAPLEAAQVIRLTSFDPDDPSLTGTVVYPAAFDDLE